MYAIKNRRTGLWVYGTWWQRSGRVVQRTSSDRALLYARPSDAEFDFKHRQCGKDYKIVKVTLHQVEDET